MSLKKLLTALVTVSMVFTLVVPAVSAASSDDLLAAAVGRLKNFGIAVGDQTGDMHLGDTITRAEIMKVLVTALGKGSDAQLLKGASAFSDTQSHWASGYVALAKAMGLTIGYPDGSFKPDNKITYGEIITLIDRAVGLDVSKQAYTWPNNYIHAAMDAGIIPAGIDATKSAGEFAIRSYVFVLADQAFLNVALPSGKTVYQTYFVTTPPTLTVDQGASLSTSKDSVTISGTTNGVKVTVGGQDVALANGAFSTTVNVKVGSNSIAVVAYDAVNNKTTSTVAVTRTPAAAASITVDLASGANLTAGSSTAVHATVKDSFGNVIPNAAVTATCDAAVGTVDASLNLTAAQKVGSGSCTFTSGAATTGAISVNVVAGPLATLTINGSASMSSTAKQTLTVSGADQYGNAVTPTGVAWSATGGVIDQSGNFAAGGASGKVTVTATSGTISATKTISVFGGAANINLSLSANNIAANGSSTTTVTATVVDASGNTVGNFSGTVNFTITNGTIAYFGSTAGTTSGSAAAANGVATISLTAGTTVGSALITATTTGGVNSTAGGNVTLTTVGQTFSSLSLSASPTAIGGDGASYSVITVKALDQNGVQMTNLSSPVVVTLQSGTPATADFASGGNAVTLSGTSTSASLNLYSKANVFGSTTITASSVTVNGAASTIAPNSVTVSTVQVYYPAKLSVDAISSAPAASSGSSTSSTGVTKITVRVLDANGNQVTNPTFNGQVTITLTPSGNSGTIRYWNGTSFVTLSGSKNATFSNGVGTLYVMDDTAETVTWTATGSYQPSVSTPATTLAQATQTATFTAGSAAKIKLSVKPGTSSTAGILAANGSMTGTLTATVIDGAGNTVTSGSYSVKISRSSSTNSSAPAVANWSDQTVTTANGTASVTITSSTNLATDTFTVADAGSTNLTANNSATVQTLILGVSNKLSLVNSNNPSGAAAVTAGSGTTIYVNVQDANGNLNVLDSSTSVTVTLTGENNGGSYTGTATAVNGLAKISLTPTVADTAYDVKATATGLTTASTPNMFGVAAGSATALKVIASTAQSGGTSLPTTIAADGATNLSLYAVAVDAYGNTATTNLPTTVTWTYSTSANFTFSGSLAGAGTGAYANAANVIATTTPAAVTVTASSSSPSLTSGSITINSVTVGTPDHVTISVGDPVTVSNNVNLQSIKVTVVDYAGNRITNPPGGTTVTLTQNGNAVLSAGSSSTLTMGQAKFTAYDQTAETVTYTAALASNSGKTVTGTGSFTPGTAANIKVGYASPAAVLGNGSSIATVTAKVVDTFGNTVTSVNGSIQFSVSSAYAYLQGGSAAGTQTVALTNGTATAVLQAKNVTNDAYVTVAASCVSCTDSTGTAVTVSQPSSDPATGLTGPGGALWVFASGSTFAPTISAATHTYSNGTATVTLTYTRPVNVTQSSDQGYFTIAGFTGNTNNPTIAQGSNAYTVVLTFTGVSDSGSGYTVTSNAAGSVTAAVYGYNNVAPTNQAAVPAP